jgi:sterol desaturase/sphingolipid hydroxylase (fatty acid hydroxylase superfamily)
MPFETFLIEHEAVMRMSVFMVTLLALAAWELAAPLRQAGRPKAMRWTNNLALGVVNIVLLRVMFPVAALSVAALANGRGVGLFNMFAMPCAVAVVISLLAFDLAVYLVHLGFHAIPALWRMHRVHHADVDVDVTTALRFHPIQMLLSVFIKLAVVLALGTPVLAVVLFETLFHVVLLFSHANVRLARSVDRVLRWFIVTPDMHRVHHSTERAETDSNFGFALPWWDRLFGTYHAEPAGGHVAMKLGIEQFREPRESWLDRLLLNPFIDVPTPAPFDQSQYGRSGNDVT